MSCLKCLTVPISSFLFHKICSVCLVNWHENGIRQNIGWGSANKYACTWKRVPRFCKSIFKILLHFIYLFIVCMCVCACICMCMHVCVLWRLEDKLKKSLLSFYHVDSRDETLMVRLMSSTSSLWAISLPLQLHQLVLWILNHDVLICKRSYWIQHARLTWRWGGYNI